MLEAREKTVRINGGNMTYLVFGKGSRPLVMIPGLSLQSIHGYALPMAYTYRIYAKDYRVYVFDKKDDLPDGCTVRDMADDLAKAMHELGIEKADVIGISQGGMIAQYLALDHPQLVRKLVLGVTLSRPNETLSSVIDSWVQGAAAGDYSVIVEDMTKKMYSKAYVKRYSWLLPWMLKIVKLNGPERFLKLAKACLTCDTYDRLEEIKCPVLVLGGRQDQICGPDASEDMAKKLNCRYHIYEELGHAAYEEAKDFDRRILSFLLQDEDVL